MRVDLLVDDCLVVEVKARSASTKEMDAFKAQALSYISLLDFPLALVINFHVECVGKYGVSRVILKGADSRSPGGCANARALARAAFGASPGLNFATFALKNKEDEK